jgi:hypothetical protein
MAQVMNISTALIGTLHISDTRTRNGRPLMGIIKQADRRPSHDRDGLIAYAIEFRVDDSPLDKHWSTLYVQIDSAPSTEGEDA